MHTVQGAVTETVTIDKKLFGLFFETLFADLIHPRTDAYDTELPQWRERLQREPCELSHEEVGRLVKYALHMSKPRTAERIVKFLRREDCFDKAECQMILDSRPVNRTYSVGSEEDRLSKRAIRDLHVGSIGDTNGNEARR